MSPHTALTIGFIILGIYLAQKFIAKKVLRAVVTGLCVFAIFGAVTHPHDVTSWAASTAERFWPFIVQGVHRATDTFFGLLGTVVGGGSR